MAKKPKNPKPDDRLAELAKRLHDTQSNVYAVGKTMGIDVTDDTFD